MFVGRGEWVHGIPEGGAEHNEKQPYKPTTSVLFSSFSSCNFLSVSFFEGFIYIIG